MKADAALFEEFAAAHRLGIGVFQPLTCINDMLIDEYDGWVAYFHLTGNSLRLPK